MGRELEQLKKMANQIADNFRWHEDGPARVADHLERFWAPAMREQLEAHARNGGDGLSEAVRAALERLRDRDGG